MKRILILMLAFVLCLSCFVACTEPEVPGEETGTQAPDGELTVEQALANAYAYVKNMYKQYLTAPETAADFTLVSAVKVGGVDYTITWTVDNEAVKVVAGEGEVTIDVDEKSATEVAYKLTAVISAADGTQSEPLVFELKVPMYNVLTYEQYYATEKDKAVVVEGLVVAVHSQDQGNKYNQLYVMDANGTGGYYVYSMEKDPVKDLGIKAGMTVSVTGTKDIYNGLHEIKNATVVVVDSTEKTLTPVDITEIFASATDLKAENLVNKLAMLVTIKGVEITDQDLSEKSQYLNFKLGNLTSYIRVYRTDLPVSAGGDEGLESILAGHTEHTAWKADVTGVVVVYGGAIYLNPVSKDCFNYIEKIQRTPAQMVDVEAEALEVPEEVKVNSVLELPIKGSSYTDVAISWASDNACAVVDAATGKVTITLPETEQTVKLTATLTLGEATKTVEFTVKVAAKSKVAPQVVENPVVDTAYKFFLTQENLGEILYLKGEMNGYYFATTTNHEEGVDVKLEAVDGGYKLYFMGGEAGDTKTYISVIDTGEHINVVFNAKTPSVWVYNAEHKTLTTTIGEETFYLGTYKTYNTFSASTIDKAATSFVGHLAVMVDSSTISDDAKVAAEKNALNLATTMDAELALPATGVTYTDVVITWTTNLGTIADNKLTVTQTAAEQTVTLTATIKSGEVTDTKEFTVTVKATAAEISIPDVLASADGTNVIVKGTVYEIKEAWSSYNNMSYYIKDALGNTLYIYRSKTQVDLGDTVTVTGAVGSYNDAKQIAKDSTAVINVDHSTVGCSYTDNCDAACDVCGATRTEIPHKWAGDCDKVCECEETRIVTTPCTDVEPVDNTCDVCGQPMKTAEEIALENANTVKDTLTFVADIYENGDVALPTNETALTNVTVTWASDNAVAVVAGDNSKVTFTASTTADTTVTLTATITATYNDGADKVEVTKTFTVKVWADIDWVPVVVDTPVVGTAYKFYMIQEKISGAPTLYLTGLMDGDYLGTSETPELAKDVYLETAGGGYYFYFMDGETKTYIGVNDSGIAEFATTPCLWTWNTTYSTLETYVAAKEKTYFLGTRNNKTFDTFSANDNTYIGTNFKGHFAVLTSKNDLTPDQKLAYAKEDLKLDIDSSVKEAGTITLPTTIEAWGATVEWASNSDKAVVSGDYSSLEITLPEAGGTVEVTLTATIKVDEASTTKEFKFTIVAPAAIKGSLINTFNLGTDDATKTSHTDGSKL